MTLGADGRRAPGRITVHQLVWGDAWVVVEDHIERRTGAQDRLQAGNKPGRRDWLDASRLELSAALARYIPARCECGAVNTIDPKRLDVDGVASY